MNEAGTDYTGSGPSDAELQHAIPPRALKSEARVGIFILAGALAALMALFLMTDPSMFRGRYSIFAVVENAAGLRRSDPVQMRGVNVGRVMSFEMVPAGVNIELEIEGEYQVPDDSRVRLVGIGLLGGRTVEILPGGSPVMAEGGDILQGTVSSDVYGIVSDIGDEATDMIQLVANLLNEPTVASFQTSAQELESLLTDFAVIAREQRSEITRLVESINEAARAVSSTTTSTAPALESIAVRADSALAAVNQNLEILEPALADLRAIMARMERGEGTLGRLSRDDSLYVNLNAAASSLQLLLDDIRENPGRYISLSIF
ncbi:MAG: MlaD family protein [Gammaproteobacteria bacterium]|nr:MlaD family protein [Gammaproteobacteria bacterium]